MVGAAATLHQAEVPGFKRRTRSAGLPLVREGGAAILWVGSSVDLARVALVADRVAARVESADAGLVVLRKLGPTPPGFPRRPGMARKRPLA